MAQPPQVPQPPMVQQAFASGRPPQSPQQLYQAFLSAAQQARTTAAAPEPAAQTTAPAPEPAAPWQQLAVSFARSPAPLLASSKLPHPQAVHVQQQPQQGVPPQCPRSQAVQLCQQMQQAAPQQHTQAVTHPQMPKTVPHHGQQLPVHPSPATAARLQQPPVQPVPPAAHGSDVPLLLLDSIRNGVADDGKGTDSGGCSDTSDAVAAAAAASPGEMSDPAAEVPPSTAVQAIGSAADDGNPIPNNGISRSGGGDGRQAPLPFQGGVDFADLFAKGDREVGAVTPSLCATVINRSANQSTQDLPLVKYPKIGVAFMSSPAACGDSI